MAIIIIIIGLTSPAETAASPNINAPRMDTELPYELGNLISLSLSISQENNIQNASKIAGKGIPFLWIAKLISRVVGILSGL